VTLKHDWGFIAIVHPSAEYDLKQMLRKEYRWSMGVPVYKGHPRNVIHASTINAKRKFRPTSACGIKMRGWGPFTHTPSFGFEVCHHCRLIVATAILTEE
jgi:hypothetical protein